nr:cationic amino acid transporter 7, chloroplastic [Quercus suber]
MKPGHPKSPARFFPNKAKGVFHGASIVYVSYIGYDAISTMAEEVHDPVKDIPVGVSGSVVIAPSSIALWQLQCLCLWVFFLFRFGA